MKILLLSLPRTGSTVFGKAMSLALKTLYLDEPFKKETISSINQNIHQKKYELLINTEDVLVKNQYGQLPYIPSIDYEKNYGSFLQLFDRKIFLLRRNIEEHVESMINLYWVGNHQNKFNQIHTKYIYEDIPDWFVNKYYTDLKEHITKGTEFIESHTNFQNRVFYYEDLFTEKNEKTILSIKEIFPNLDENILRPYLLPEKRYRYYKDKTIL